MSDTLSKRIVSAKAGNCPFPLERIAGQHVQPLYAIWAHEVDELIAEIARLTAELEQAKSIAATALSEGTRVATTLHIAQSELAKCERERGILKHQRSVPLPALTPESLLAYGEEVIARGDHNRGAQYCCLATTWMAELAAMRQHVGEARAHAQSVDDMAVSIQAELDGAKERERVLREAVEKAPHDGWCAWETMATPWAVCNCWKRAALGEDGGNG